MTIASFRSGIQRITLPACFRTWLQESPLHHLHSIVPLSKYGLVWQHRTLRARRDLSWSPCIIRLAKYIPKLPRSEKPDRAGCSKATELLAPSGLTLLVVSLGRLGITYLWLLTMEAKPSRGGWQERRLPLKLFREFLDQHQLQKPQTVNGMIQQSMVVTSQQGFQSRAQYWYSAAFLEAVFLWLGPLLYTALSSVISIGMPWLRPLFFPRNEW
jgi:hypothetical protein